MNITPACYVCVGQFEASSGRQDPAGLVQTLQQEFSLVNLQIRNVNVEVRSHGLSILSNDEQK